MSANTLQEDLALALMIRAFEETLLELFGKGQLSGTTHTSIGHEIVPVALRSSLTRDDYVFSNHRGHAHFLAMHEDPKGLMAEIMGRKGAVCGGVGGSQHVNVGNFFSTGIQGEGIGVATGVAHHLKCEGEGKLAVAYVGDGTFGQGLVYEALNMAALWSLPLLVVVENNHIAQSTPSSLNMAGTIAGRAAAFGVPHLHISSPDIGEIRRLTEEPIARIRRQPGPLMLEFEVPRLASHSKGDDTREASEIAALHLKDWSAYYKKKDPQGVARLEREAKARIKELAELLLQAPPSRGGSHD